mgnify:CR=1 FL=1
MYFVMNSMEYAKQMIPEADREYRVMFRLADAEHMTTDEIVESGKEIGEDFGVPEGNVVGCKLYGSVICKRNDRGNRYGCFSRNPDYLQYLLCVYDTKSTGIWKIKSHRLHQKTDSADGIP